MLSHVGGHPAPSRIFVPLVLVLCGAFFLYRPRTYRVCLARSHSLPLASHVSFPVYIAFLSLYVPYQERPLHQLPEAVGMHVPTSEATALLTPGGAMVRDANQGKG